MTQILRSGQVLDEYKNPVPGATIYVYDNTTGAQAAITSDGTATLTQPVKTDEFGVYTYYADENYYREDTYYGGKLRYKEIYALGNPGADLSLRSELASNNGAGLVGVEIGSPGRFVTLQEALDVESPMGALGPGVIRNLNFDKRFTSATNDSTSSGLDMRSFVISTEFDGSNGAYQVAGLHLTPNFYHDGVVAPNITFGYGIKQACRIGLNNNLNGTLTTFRGIETHTAIEGHNHVTDLWNFNVGDFDWLNGDGTADNVIGYHCGNLTGDGGAARINTLAACYYAPDQTAGAPMTVAFYSNFGDAANKYSFYGGGSASMVHAGKVRIGDLTPPTNQLEVHGLAKISSDGTVLSSGGYHELRIQNSGTATAISNSHASTPSGLRINFSAASPNDQTQTFLLCDDSTTTRMVIYSDGSLRTQGGLGFLVGAGGTVAQAASKSTGVTLNARCGQITLSNSALAANSIASFTFTNSRIAADDNVHVWVKSGNASIGSYRVAAEGNATGSRTVIVENKTGGPLSEALVIGFSIIKAVIA
jgi:hypothetical protein